jgi:hypothetical protein
MRLRTSHHFRRTTCLRPSNDMRRTGVREAVSGVSALILVGPVALIRRQRRRQALAPGMFSAGRTSCAAAPHA